MNKHTHVEVLALIPARGGSKGIPRKNIKQFCGKPLMAWTIEEAKKSRYVTRIVVSTDDEEIAGFHAYDLDISLRFAKKYKNYVIGDILIEHFSNGNPDKAFFEENILVRKKCGSDFQLIQDSKIEMLCFKEFLYNYYRYSGINVMNAWRTLKFIPKGRINFNDYIILLKTYYRYFKFKKYFKETWLRGAHCARRRRSHSYGNKSQPGCNIAGYKNA